MDNAEARNLIDEFVNNNGRGYTPSAWDSRTNNIANELVVWLAERELARAEREEREERWPINE